MEAEHDVFGRWAAEEFVAASRADGRESRSAHRGRAEFFADIFQELKVEVRKPSCPNAIRGR